MSEHIKVTMPVAVLFLNKVLEDNQLQGLILNHGSSECSALNTHLIEFLSDIIEILKDNPNLNINF